MKKPQLTVCMPVYNGEKYLDESIGSVLSQDLDDFVFLLYDDGSTDGSLDKLKSFGDSRMKILSGDENRGGIYARTQLINAVDTKYCMWLDDDDRYCRTDALSHALRKIKSNNYDLVNFVRIDEVDSQGRHTFVEPRLHGDFSYCGDKLFEKFYPVDNHFIFNSKIFRTSILRQSIPEEDVLSRRFCTDDMFFAAMWFFTARRYCNDAVSEPILEYKKDVGLWGSHATDCSPRRIGDLVLLQYSVLVSLYNRMVAIKPLNGVEVRNLVDGTNFPMVAKMIGYARRKLGDEYADNLMKIWHSALGADGSHLLNGVDGFCMPKYIGHLEGIMRGKE